MPPTGSDRELRRLVADLAATTSEDMAAVLGMLDPRHAAQVRSMLAAYGGVADAFHVEAAAATVNTEGLSDWLAARVTNRQPAGLEAYRMTPPAVEALRHLVMSRRGDSA